MQRHSRKEHRENKEVKTRKYKEEIQNLKLDKIELEDELTELKDKHLRTHAEFQNIKKRIENEKNKSIEKANEKFALDMLDILDSLYLAYETISTKNEKEGILNTIRKLESVFKKYNITETLYEIFNPEIHEAVKIIDSDEAKGSIVEVLRKGYLINNRILRPAMVSISK